MLLVFGFVGGCELEKVFVVRHVGLLGKGTGWKGTRWKREKEEESGVESTLYSVYV